MILLPRRPAMWLICSAVFIAALAAPSLAAGTDQTDEDAAALVDRLGSTYREARSLSRGTMTMMNLPPSEEDEMGTLGLSELTTFVSRLDDGTIEQIRYEDRSGSIQITGDADSWVIRQAWWDGQCAEVPRQAADGSSELFTRIIDLQQPALEPAIIVPFEFMLALDGSLDVFFGVPVQVEFLPENHEMALQLGEMAKMIRAEGVIKSVLLSGTNARAALAISEESGMLVSAVLEVDVSHLGMFDALGLRVWIAQGFTDLAEITNDPIEHCDKIFATFDDLEEWNQTFSAAKILEAREMLEDNLQMMQGQLSVLEEDDPRRAWGELFSSRMQRVLDEALQTTSEE